MQWSPKYGSTNAKSADFFLSSTVLREKSVIDPLPIRVQMFTDNDDHICSECVIETTAQMTQLCLDGVNHVLTTWKLKGQIQFETHIKVNYFISESFTKH